MKPPDTWPPPPSPGAPATPQRVGTAVRAVHVRRRRQATIACGVGTLLLAGVGLAATTPWQGNRTADSAVLRQADQPPPSPAGRGVTVHPSPSPSPCTGATLAVTYVHGGLGAGNVLGQLQIRTTGNVACTLTGSAIIRPVDAHQQPVGPLLTIKGLPTAFLSTPRSQADTYVQVRLGGEYRDDLTTGQTCPPDREVTPAFWRVTVAGQTFAVRNADPHSPNGGDPRTGTGPGLSYCRNQVSIRGVTIVQTGTRGPTSAPSKAPARVSDYPSCSSDVLRLGGGRQGEVGTAHGTVTLTNTGATTCRLDGIPDVTLLTANGHRLPLKVLPATDGQYNAVALPPDAGPATATLMWTNWCRPDPGPLDIRLTLPGTGTVAGPFNGPPDYDYVPPCQDANQPSVIRVVDAYQPPVLHITLTAVADSPSCADLPTDADTTAVVSAYRASRLRHTPVTRCATQAAISAYCDNACTDQNIRVPGSPGPMCLYQCGTYRVTSIQAIPGQSWTGPDGDHVALTVQLTDSHGNYQSLYEYLTLAVAHGPDSGQRIADARPS